jgi:hypothetical protein
MRMSRSPYTKWLPGAKLDAVFMRPIVGSLLATTIIAVAASYVLGLRGYLQQSTWVWLLLWGLGCAALLVSTLLDDPGEERRVRRIQLEEDFGLAGIHDPTVANLLSTAIGYRLDFDRFERNAAAAAGGQLVDTLAQVTQWLAGIGRLAHHIDEFRISAANHAAATLDLRQRIDGLEARARENSDETLLRQLRETIAGRRFQLRLLEEEASLNESASLRLEQAVAELGTVSLQFAMVARKDRELSDMDKLRPEIDTEIEAIDSLIAAYDRTSSIHFETHTWNSRPKQSNEGTVA